MDEAERINLKSKGGNPCRERLCCSSRSPEIESKRKEK